MEIKSYLNRLPMGLERHIHQSLRWIDPADLDGVGAIKLEERIRRATDRDPQWHRNATDGDLSVNGLYHSRTKSSEASITLFVRDLYRGIPRCFWLTPIVTVKMARTVAHEVGHHLIAKRGYVFDERERVTPFEYEEEMANRYSFFVINRMTRRWRYRIAIQVTKLIAAWHSGVATVDWKSGHFTSASERWYQAFQLDPDFDEAVYWYKRSKDAERGDSM